MLELFEWPPTRSQRVKWVMAELGVPHTSHLVNLPHGEHNTEDYRAVHPLGFVPAVKTDSYAIFESVAIVLQLIDEHPDSQLAPALGTPERALYYQWSVFAGSELDPALMLYFDNSMRPPEAMHPPGTPYDPRLAELGRGDIEVRAKVLSDALANRDFLLGSNFSGADILVGHSCFMIRHMGLLGGFPVLEAYYGRLQQRPAHRRVYANFE